MKDERKKKTSLPRRIMRWVVAILLLPIVLFMFLSLLVYIPPVQRFVVNQVESALAAQGDWLLDVGAVRLAFPLDLALHDVQLDYQTDTLLQAGAVRVDVKLLPLFSGRVDVDGVALYDTKVDTRDLLPNVHLRGSVGTLEAAAHGVEWQVETAHVDHVQLKNSQLYVALSDTAQADTAKTDVRWRIDIEKVSVQETAVNLSLPGDSIRAGVSVDDFLVENARLDVGKNQYDCQRISWNKGGVRFATRSFQGETDAGNRAFALQLVGPDASLPLWTTDTALCVDISPLTIQFDSLHYGGSSSIHARLAQCRLLVNERIHIERLETTLSADSARISLSDFLLKSPHSELVLAAHMPWSAIHGKAYESVQLSLQGMLGADDLRAAVAIADSVVARQIRSDNDLHLALQLQGNRDSLQATKCELSWTNVAEIAMQGYVTYPLEMRRNGNLNFELLTKQTSPLQALLPADVKQTLNIPSHCTIKGKASFNSERMALDATSLLAGGEAHFDASLGLKNQNYRFDCNIRKYPLSAFLPQSQMERLTARLQIVGDGYNPLEYATRIAVSGQIDSFIMANLPMQGIHLNGLLEKGKGNVQLTADNEWLSADIQLRTLFDQQLQAELDAFIPYVDLKRLGGVKDTVYLGANLQMKAVSSRTYDQYGFDGKISQIQFVTPGRTMPAKDLGFRFDADADSTGLHVEAGDMQVELGTDGTIEQLLQQVENFLLALKKQTDEKNYDQYALKDQLPMLNLQIDIGTDNPLSNVLRFMDCTYDFCNVDISTDIMNGLKGHIDMRHFKKGKIQLDDIDVSLSQDTTGLNIEALVHNYERRNPNKFDARVKFYLLNRGAGFELRFDDAKGQTGVDIGLLAEVDSGVMDVKVYPDNPIIAYRMFEVNRDNYVRINKDRNLWANVRLESEDGMGIRLTGEPVDTVNDVTLSLHRLNLEGLSEIVPYLPQLGGYLSGDFHVVENEVSLSAMAVVQGDELTYEGVRIGDVGIETMYLPKEGGEHHANVYVSKDENEVLAMTGTYFSSDAGLFVGNVQLIDFPLEMANGFLAEADIALAGTANGVLDMEGPFTGLKLNGALDFDATHVKSEAYGFDFVFDERAINIVESRMVFDKFEMQSRQSNNPLRMDGYVDMTNLADMGVNLEMEARDFEILNTKRNSRSLLFGKMYVDYTGTVKGTVSDLAIRGKLNVRERTDLTYILKDSPLTVDDRLHDLVQFVSFEDSLEQVGLQIQPSTVDLTMGVSISEAARFRCDLSEDGENFVEIEGGGNLTLRMTKLGETNLTGRFVANSGDMKYSLPIIPLKTFHLKSGSYVDFTGNMMNPTLNIQATERTKATVVENDVPRTVAFDVGVSITQPLEKMGIEFIIDAPEDLSMQNRLSSMTKEQRGKSAVAMLATGIFLDDESMSSGGSGIKASNALNAFLQSEIQNITGAALRTIDLSIGMESGTSEVGTETTDYSFRFAKRLWGNRVSIIIGGKVSTGEDAQNSATSFIDNVALEYRVGGGTSCYVKAFYDRGTRDPFEGQLMTTGGGLVLRKKTHTLGELFIFRNSKKEDARKKAR